MLLGFGIPSMLLSIGFVWVFPAVSILFIQSFLFLSELFLSLLCLVYTYSLFLCSSSSSKCFSLCPSNCLRSVCLFFFFSWYSFICFYFSNCLYSPSFSSFSSRNCLSLCSSNCVSSVSFSSWSIFFCL
uniref:Uncharacterized protein n=1 Tax=Cacopsylla melanoneura TaxID=428564 RepID=A0A8D9E3Y1_9HEMI